MSIHQCKNAEQHGLPGIVRRLTKSSLFRQKNHQSVIAVYQQTSSTATAHGLKGKIDAA